MTAMAKGLPDHIDQQHLYLSALARAHYRWAGGLIIDNFAGGGGASTGIWKANVPLWALDRQLEAVA